MKERGNNIEGEGQRRKSGRTRVPVQQFGEKRSKRTRGKVKESSQQYALPQNIPISDSLQLKIFQSFQGTTTKVVFQIPLYLFKNEKMTEQTEIRVDITLIQIKLTLKDPDTLFFEAKIQSLNQHKEDEEEEEQKTYNIWGKSSWVTTHEVSTKILNHTPKKITGEFREVCKVKTANVNSDIFVALNFREKVQQKWEYSGLINQGNTCYMNSYLQMLNHISEFRNLVFDAKVEDQSKFPATLQILFYRLGNDRKSVTAEPLVKSFGWTRKQAQVQQDAQEFSCLFFEVLEKKLEEVCQKKNHKSMSELFEGRLLHYIQCTNIDYRSDKDQRFFDIQLNITKNLQTSLDEYVSEQILNEDNMYDTEIYGKQEARKGVKIQVLPPIVMIQLKRFEFSHITLQNEKVMERFEYPNEIDFSKWLVSGKSQIYQLYGVLVHEGGKADSGHYYVYLNIDGKWFKFNDEIVLKVHEKQVFDYNFGGSIDVVELDTREMSVKMRQIVSSSTAYMLVYVKKDQKQKLLNQKTIYPKWLKERDILKMEEREEQKARKNYYHDIQTLDWEEEFLGKQAYEIGLVPKSREGITFQDLGKINKNQKISEWIQQFNKKGKGAYLHVTCLDKAQYQCVVNMQGKIGTFQDIIREAYNPVIIFIPKIIKPESFLMIVKEHLIGKETSIKFQDALEIPKTTTNSVLIDILKENYDEKGYTTKLFFQEKKTLRQMKPSSSMILGPTSLRNCMIIVIVQKVKEEINEKEIVTTEEWYEKQKNSVDFLLKSEDGRYELPITIDQNRSVEQLRNLIFQERLSKDEDYCSPENIILKSKPKKTSKTFQEQQGMKTVRDLLKGCDKEKIVMFCPSTLKADERINQMEVKVRYRFKDLSLSDPLYIILNKQSNDENILYKTLFSNEIIKKQTKKEGGNDIRILLMTKDFYLINDIVEKNGYIIGKGQITSILQKQKGANLIVESAVSKKKSEDMWPILLHHLSMNADRIGKPRYLQFPKGISLSRLRIQILQLLKDEQYEWEQKIYPLNTSKIEVFAYVKDIKRAIELSQIINNDDDCEEKKEKNEEKMKQEGEQQEKDEQEEDIKINQEEKNKNKKEVKKKRNGNGKKDEIKDEIKDEEKDEIEDEIEDEVNGEKTLQNTFPKAKIIKVIVKHLYLTKAVNPMKINIE